MQRHYVVFVGRGADSPRCLFFNDLPGLTEGAPRELGWGDVPELCRRYSFLPRLALYESLEAAAEYVESAQDVVRGDAGDLQELGMGRRSCMRLSTRRNGG